MDWAELVRGYLETLLVWPVVGLAALAALYRPLRDLLNSLVRVKFNNTEIELRRNWRNVDATDDVLVSGQNAPSAEAASAGAQAALEDGQAPPNKVPPQLQPLPDINERRSVNGKKLDRRSEANLARSMAYTWLEGSKEEPPAHWRSVRNNCRRTAETDPSRAAQTLFYAFVDHILNATLPNHDPKAGNAFPDDLVGHYPGSWIEAVKNLREVLQYQTARMTSGQALTFMSQLEELLVQHVILSREYMRTGPPQSKGQQGS